MTEQNPTQTTPETPSTDEVEVEPNFVQKFANKFPRAAKAVAITGGVLVLGGTAVTANTMRKNKHHLDAAADEARGALNEFGNAVSPSPETDS